MTKGMQRKTAAMHKNDIDVLTNKHNAVMTEMAQENAQTYMALKNIKENDYGINLPKTQTGRS